MDTIAASQFRQILLRETPIIDVRAPVEFIQGAIPGSVNFPILNDDERAQVGTTYKQRGAQAATELGHRLVSGVVREQRLAAWQAHLAKHPTAIITCFRGGLRSQTAQAWLKESGFPVARIEGGYKAVRQFLMEQTERLVPQLPLTVISGATGSGKSLLIRALSQCRKTCDLENIANHRGSAFGSYATAQPSPSDFENRLAKNLMSLEDSGDGSAILIEDESRLIGRCVQPQSLFDHLRASPVVVIDEDVASRVETTFQDYILESALGQPDGLAARQTFLSYQESLRRISKKLGDARFREVNMAMETAMALQQQTGDLSGHRQWIEMLLVYYYDPMYLGSLQKRAPKILFRGSRQHCFEFLQNFGDSNFR